MASYCVFTLSGGSISIQARANSNFDLDQLIKLFSLPRHEILHHGYYIGEQKHYVYVATPGFLQGRSYSLESGFLAYCVGSSYAVIHYVYPILAPEAGAALLKKMAESGIVPKASGPQE